MTLVLKKKVSADALSFGFGAVILQWPDASSEWKAVAFAFRTMTEMGALCTD